MSANQVPLWVPIVVAVLGLAGVLAAQVIANRREDKRWGRERQREVQRNAETRSDRRRQELADAIAAFAASATSLKQAEFDRGKKRIKQAPEVEREPARQETYRLRAETESKMYLVSLLSDQETDRDLVSDADAVIKLCHRISTGPGTESELQERNHAATEALEKLIKKASQRVRS